MICAPRWGRLPPRVLKIPFPPTRGPLLRWVRTRSIRTRQRFRRLSGGVVGLVEEPALVSKEDNVVEWEQRICPPLLVVDTSASPIILPNRPLKFFCRMRSDGVP